MKFKILFFAVLICAIGVFAAVPANLPAGYGLAWSDEFDTGSTLNSKNWGYLTGCTGYGNAELQNYTAGANVTMENGCAVIWIKHETLGGCNYTSTRMVTRGKKEFKYGYFEARIKTPKGKGLWPSFWTMGTSGGWPSCGELELYEQRTGPQMVNGSGAAPGIGDNTFIATCHYLGTDGTSYNSRQVDYTACLCDTFHTYALLWDSLSIKYYFDDKQFWTAPDINQSTNFTAFHQPHYFIANVAVGGNYLNSCCTPVDNSIFPQKMYIDYIRVYQRNSVEVINGMKNHSQSSLENPSTAQMKVYNMAGKMVADYTSNVRIMKAGSNYIKALPANLSNGIYVAKITDNGRMLSQRFVISR
jgi:beta-glucanase (GH16 family)